MADSPKCPNCLKKGLKAQTYKVAGKAFFKCHNCKESFPKSLFEDIEFKWRTQDKEWDVWSKKYGPLLTEANPTKDVLYGS